MWEQHRGFRDLVQRSKDHDCINSNSHTLSVDVNFPTSVPERRNDMMKSKYKIQERKPVVTLPRHTVRGRDASQDLCQPSIFNSLSGRTACSPKCLETVS